MVFVIAADGRIQNVLFTRNAVGTCLAKTITGLRYTLDRHKQDSLYVGFSQGRIRSPARFGATQAHRQLRYVLGAFERLGDLPFNGVFEKSTRSTKKEAK
ncbi:MAG: hypothetical protein DME82_03550, partial [Verrucomicrobia bacterium]